MASAFPVIPAGSPSPRKPPNKALSIFKAGRGGAPGSPRSPRSPRSPVCLHRPHILPGLSTWPGRWGHLAATGLKEWHIWQYLAAFFPLRLAPSVSGLDLLGSRLYPDLDFSGCMLFHRPHHPPSPSLPRSGVLCIPPWLSPCPLPPAPITACCQYDCLFPFW